MGSTVAEAKKGIRQFLQTTEGLRAAGAVTVRTREPLPAEFTAALIVLGGATATQAPAGLRRRAETVTLTCWIHVTTAGSGEDAIDTARDRAFEILGLIEAALRADPQAAGSVPDPGRIDVTSSTLEDIPVDWNGSAAERAQLQFQLSWTSHT
jgi:hypothetical protein